MPHIVVGINELPAIAFVEQKITVFSIKDDHAAVFADLQLNLFSVKIVPHRI